MKQCKNCKLYLHYMAECKLLRGDMLLGVQNIGSKYISPKVCDSYKRKWYKFWREK